MLIKPDRAHHCSVCGTCVLKVMKLSLSFMFRVSTFFVFCNRWIIIVPGSIHAWTSAITSFSFCFLATHCCIVSTYRLHRSNISFCFGRWVYFNEAGIRYGRWLQGKHFLFRTQGKLDGGMGRFHILFLFFVSVMFAVSLVSLFGYHLYLVALNRTTLGKGGMHVAHWHWIVFTWTSIAEAFRAPIFRVGGPDKNGYHLGHYNNFQEVFGDDWKVWFLPVFSRYVRCVW